MLPFFMPGACGAESASDSAATRQTAAVLRTIPFSLYASQNHPAGWQSGYAAACKAVYAGSIPTPASNFQRAAACPDGEIGRRSGLKIRRP